MPAAEGAPPPPPIAIGAHCSASGGLWRTIERAIAIEAEAVQFFGASPRAWRPTNHKPEAFERFRELRAESGIGQAWLHGSYLVSLAPRNEEHYEKSIASVVNALSVAARAGAEGVVLHSGSHLGRGFEAVLPEVVSAIGRIFDEAPEGPFLALENAAGQQGPIGGTFGELGAILDAADSPRLRVCLDTCHTFAAGYDITTPEGMAETLEEFGREIGLDLLAVIHANDSKQELGSGRDRHENIGEGHIGYEGFRTILGEPAFAGRALLLEVPGFEGDGPDLENVRRLKRIRDEVSQG